MTTKTSSDKSRRHRVITDTHLYNNHYSIVERERELLKRRHAEVPPNLPAIMGTKEASEYLDVNISTLKRWHDRGVLPAMVNPDNGYKTYLLSHLWVFKMLWFEDQQNDR